MAFKARFHRREEGGYEAVYGKSSKQLSAILLQQSYSWYVASGFGAGIVTPSKKIGDVKEGWAALAEAGYGGGGMNTIAAPAIPSPRLSGPPSLRRRPGPPSLRAAQGIEPVHFRATEQVTDKGERIYEPSTFELEMGKFEQNPSVPKADDGVACCPSCNRPFQGWRKEEGQWLPPCRCDMPLEDYSPDPFDPRMYEKDETNAIRTLSPIGVLDKVYAWMLSNPTYVTTDGQLDSPWADVQSVLHRTTGYAEYREERFQ